MCVIVTAEKGSMPTIDQLTRMSETNPDGAGIAWHDGNGLHRVRRSPACNRRRDTARRTFRPSPSEEQAND